MDNDSPNRPTEIAVLLSGRGSNFAALLAAIDAGRVNGRICVVLSDKAQAAGLETARQHGIPTVVVPRRPKERDSTAFNEALVAALQPFNPELIVLAGFMRVVGKRFIDAFPHRIINIHPSLLPSFRGLHVHEQVLTAGVGFSGCTVHFVEEEVDAGAIIAQAVVPVLEHDSAETLAARVLAAEHQLLPRVVAGLCTGAIRYDGTTVTRAPELAPEDRPPLFSLNISERR
ncbi:MAG: phosphoribosylglycinamide formyltransferase [Bdellovibrionales bacterium]|nr:phosphoribosylglycinamide formyltransferase [Bdellovibrionales bacterium]